jgi:hypothetical protein
MYDILYYSVNLGIGLGIGVFGSFGVLYVVNKDAAMELTSQISWNLVKLYHYFKNTVDKNVNKYNKLNDKKKKGCVVEFLGYVCKNNNIFRTYELNNDYIFNNEFDIMFLKFKDKYKRVHDKNNLECLDDFKNNINSITNTNKPLIQVQIEQFSKKTDIHEHLEHFYLNDNIILDEIFLKWYLYHFYGITLQNNYILHIIDDNINIFQMNNFEYLSLSTADHENYSYVIKKDVL